VGSSFEYDDNVMPGGASDGEEAFSISPYIGASWVNITPQTVVDIYARFGVMYYLDAPAAMDDYNQQSRVSLNITHNVSERLILKTQNFFSYELEPNYAYGYSGSRQSSEHFFWQSDNSVSYRWTERLGTATGLVFSGLAFDDSNSDDRITWEAYNQFRYSLSQQSILTAEYRYKDISSSGAASDSAEHFFLLGIEHRFSPNTIGIYKAGVQLRDVSDGSQSTSPFVEAAMFSQVNEHFLARGFFRYGLEGYDTVEAFGPTVVEFDERETLRLGLSGEYTLSQMLSIFGGLDYIPTTYAGGRNVVTSASFADQKEDVLNAYIGLSLKFTANVTGSASYNYTDSNSDIPGREYDRSRISLGVSASF
jgi:hypothetical protein